MHLIEWFGVDDMLELLIGFISGIVSGTGMGGGTILILCLSIFLGINQKIAQATNLIFFIPTSIAAIYINIKQKNINVKLSKIIILGGILGAIIGSIFAKNIDIKMLRKVFGNFLAVIAVYEIYMVFKMYKKKKKNNTIKKKHLRRKI